MKKLLEDCLSIIEQVEWVYEGHDVCPGCGSQEWDGGHIAHLPNCKWVSSVDGLKTQLAALSPDANGRDART